MSEEQAKMPYPIITVAGAAEPVLPRNWRPQANLHDGQLNGGTYSTANGGPIKNEGEKWFQ